jgi:5-oxopent-3-ene-1,2,5-tricarboxylate decarboxylase/2-hydroxyhepta-2,4-diene-1,7-dioate isomerase
MNQNLSYPATVYGVALNDKPMLDRLGDALLNPPYQKPPIAPVLYIKTRNTFASPDTEVGIPTEPGLVRIDATVGAVIGRRASKVSAKDALDYVAGYVIVSDLTLPHVVYYRPAVRQRCRDQFCPMTLIMSQNDSFDVDTADIKILINDVQVHSRSLRTLVRPLTQLLVDVTEFMTLSEGDVLLLGPPDDAPTGRVGDSIRIDVAGLGSLQHSLVAEQTVEVMK